MPKTCLYSLLVSNPLGWIGAVFYLLFDAKPGVKRLEVAKHGGKCYQNFANAEIPRQRAQIRRK